LAQPIGAIFLILPAVSWLCPSAIGKSRRSRGIFCPLIFAADQQRTPSTFDFDKILC